MHGIALACALVLSAPPLAADPDFHVTRHIVWKSTDGQAFAEVIEESRGDGETFLTRQIVRSPGRNRSVLAFETELRKGRFRASFWDKESQWWAELELDTGTALPLAGELTQDQAFEWSKSLADSEATITYTLRTGDGHFLSRGSSTAGEDPLRRLREEASKLQVELPESAREALSFLRRTVPTSELGGRNSVHALISILEAFLPEAAGTKIVYESLDWERGESPPSISSQAEGGNPSRLTSRFLEEFGEIPDPSEAREPPG